MTSTEARYPAHLDPQERDIIDLLVRDALEAGFTIKVRGEGFTDLDHSTDYTAITAEIAATGQTTLHMRNGTERAAVMLVHGNGADVISNYSDNETAEKLLKRAEAYAEQPHG